MKNIFCNIQLSEEMKSFIDDLGYNITEDTEQECHLYFTDDERSVVQWTAPTSAHVNDKSLPFAFVQEDILDNQLFSKMFSHYLAGEVALRPEACFKGLVVNNNTVKVLDRGSYGLYTDIICSRAGQFSFNSRRVRSLLTAAFLIFDRMNLTKELMMPLEVDYGRTHDTFYVQFACFSTAELKSNIFFKSLIRIINDCELIELSFNEKTERVIMRCCWTLTKRKQPPHLLVYDKSTRFMSTVDDDSLLAETKFDTEVHPEPFEEKDESLDPVASSKKWRLMRKVLNSSMELKKSTLVKGEEWPEQVDITHVKGFVEDIDEETVTFDSLTKDEVNILVTALNNEDPIERFEKFRYDELIEIDPEEYMDSICNNVSEMDAERLRGAFGDDDDAMTISGGESEDGIESVSLSGGEGDESSQRVQGEKADLDENHHQLVKGGGSLEEENSIWQVKKLNVAEKLKDKYSKLNNPTPATVESELGKTLRDELNADSSKIEAFVGEIVDSISEELLPKSIPNSQLINRTLGTLKSSMKKSKSGELKVGSLDLKLMLSFTEGLMRKAKAVEEMGLNSIGGSGDLSEEGVGGIGQLMDNNDKLLEEKNKLIEEKNELKSELYNLQRELASSVENESRQKEKAEQSSLIDNERQKTIDKLTEDVKSAKSEGLELKRQLMINENEMNKMKTLVSRMKQKETETRTNGPVADPKKDHRIKQLEKINGQLLENKTKIDKELAAKKSELYSAKLENKTINGKLKQLEKKLEIMNKRKAG